MQSGPEQLRGWMKRRELNLEQTAEIFGWDPTFISKIVNGKRRPGRAHAIALEDVAGIPIRAWESSDLDETVSVGSRNGKKRHAGRGVK